jgi:hypothetical protein
VGVGTRDSYFHRHLGEKHVGERWPARAGAENEVHSQEDCDTVRVSRFIGFGALMRSARYVSKV